MRFGDESYNVDSSYFSLLCPICKSGFFILYHVRIFLSNFFGGSKNIERQERKGHKKYTAAVLAKTERFYF